MTRLATLAVVLLLAWGHARQDAPAIAKVDPPSWWAGHSINPVRLLIRGSGLSGARLESAQPGITVGPLSTNARGTSAFADVTIAADAAAGDAGLHLVAGGRRFPLPFAINDPLPRRGRFQGFDQDDVIYLLMPDRFANGDGANDRPARSPGLLDRRKSRFYHGGDLQGVIDRLPYLQDLGVTTLWLNPVYDNADRMDPVRRYDGEPFTDYHGYGAVDFYAVDERLGDVATFRRLVDEAHARGLKIMQDQVGNHTGPFHPWVQDPPTATWFNGSAAQHLANSFDAQVLLDPRASARMRRAVLDGWFADVLPDLNQQDPEVARYIIQNSLWWVGMTGLDAIRQDTVPYVPAAFWRDWVAALTREYPDLRVVGEVLEPVPAFVAAFQRGSRNPAGVDTGLHSVFDYPLFFAVRRALTGGRGMREISSILYQDGLYADPGRLTTLIGSHDVRRFMGEEGASPASLKLAAALLFTMRGIPQWYYGDEVALPGGDDPHNRGDFPGGWPDDPRSGFTRAGRTPVEEDVFSHVRALIHLRRELAPLRRGPLVHLAVSHNAYAYARTGPGGPVIVALNNGGAAEQFSIAAAEVGLSNGAMLRDRIGRAGDLAVRDGLLAFTIEPKSSAVFVPR